MQIRLFLTFAVLGLLFPLSFHTCVFISHERGSGMMPRLHFHVNFLRTRHLLTHQSLTVKVRRCEHQAQVLSDLQSPYSSHLSDSHVRYSLQPRLLPAQPRGLCLLLSAAPPPQVTQLFGRVQAVHSLDRSWNGLGDGSW